MPVFSNPQQKQDLKNSIKNSINNYLNSELDRSSLTTYKSVISLLISECYEEVTKSVQSENYDAVSSVTERFSGRGKSWVKINTDDSLWTEIVDLLNNSSLKENCQEYMDIFQNLGFAYLRYYRTYSFKTAFEVRVNGSLKSSPVKLFVDHSKALELEFLEGTPISVGLELGSRNKLSPKKINTNCNPEDIGDLPFQNINDII